MPLGQATRVGPYEIVASIGRGAMGDVYMARDSRLNRNVAIKVISETGADESKRRRFTQEARAASSLNHPNIVTVHDVGTESGMAYIVSELVRGESLRQIMNAGALPMKRLVDIAVQIAEGLAAAHDAGIVHRDLKPENIMLTGDGRVKILDFGLAKPLIEEHLEGATVDNRETMDEALAGTQPGLILGTVGYMSPEQARGAVVGPQSDQFALGVLMHEMATGHRAFRGATPMETLIQIANIERPPFTPGPVAFRMLVDRCLAREPEKRFATTQEIVARLQRIREQMAEAEPVGGAPLFPAEEGDSGSIEVLPAVQPQPPLRPRWWQRISPRLVAAVLFSVALVAMGMLLAWRFFTPPLGDPLAYRFTPLVTEAGLELFPSWSPSGRLLAYSGEKDGVLQIFTRSPRSSLFTQVTRAGADCVYPFWSADGSRIFFSSAYEGKPALWVVNATGGTPELIAAGVAAAALSPDGNTLVMLKGEDPVYRLMVASPPFAKPQPLASGPLRNRGFLFSSVLRFTPDGRSVSLWASTPEGRSEFWIAPLGGGEPTRYFASLEAAPFARVFSWLPDGRRILFAERRGFWSTDHLWVGDTRTGEVRLVTNGTGREQWPAVAPSGHEAAFSSVDLRYEVITAPLDGSSAPAARDAGQLIEASPVWSPVANEYAYVTGQGGEPEIRLCNVDSGWERKLAGVSDFPDGPTYSFSDLAFAPNGQSVAFTRIGGSGESIWMAMTIGEPPIRLNGDSGLQRGATWSPDGNQIAYWTVRNGKNALVKTRLASGAPATLVAEEAGVDPQWSPRGDVIAAIHPAGGINLLPAGGGPARRMGASRWLAITWTKGGSRVIGLQAPPDGHLVVAWMDVATGEESRVLDLGRYPAAFGYALAAGIPAVRGFSIAPDSRQAIFSVLRARSDLWLLEGLSRK